MKIEICYSEVRPNSSQNFEMTCSSPRPASLMQPVVKQQMQQLPAHVGLKTDPFNWGLNNSVYCPLKKKIPLSLW